MRGRPALRDLERKRARARRRVAETVQKLEAVSVDAFREWIVEGREPRLDESAVRRVELHLGGFVEAVRREMARLGVGAGELDLGLGWAAGRTEWLLATPWEITLEEAELLCGELGVSMDRLFDRPGYDTSMEETIHDDEDR